MTPGPQLTYNINPIRVYKSNSKIFTKLVPNADRLITRECKATESYHYVTGYLQNIEPFEGKTREGKNQNINQRTLQ